MKKFEIIYTTSDEKERTDVVKADTEAQAIEAILESESLYEREVPDVKIPFVLL